MSEVASLKAKEIRRLECLKLVPDEFVYAVFTANAVGFRSVRPSRNPREMGSGEPRNTVYLIFCYGFHFYWGFWLLLYEKVIIFSYQSSFR